MIHFDRERVPERVVHALGHGAYVRHISGNGVHTFRFVNDKGESQLFKWYWLPVLGHRALVYDEATKIAGKNTISRE